jgi:hypothetical protein
VSNHLEDLVAEWLEYNGYFVRKSVLVGPRPNGGFEGELDVVAVHPTTKHLLHVECSLDAHPWPKREERFSNKFARGRKYVRALLNGFEFDHEPDQVALLQMAGNRAHVGGGRIVGVADFVSEVLSTLSTKSPIKMAVPSTFPLLRTMQLAAQPQKRASTGRALLRRHPTMNVDAGE